MQTIVARAIQRVRLSCLGGLKSGREIAALKVCLFLTEVNEREGLWAPAGLDANENMQVRVARRSPAALEHQQGHDVARTPTPTFRLVKRWAQTPHRYFSCRMHEAAHRELSRTKLKTLLTCLSHLQTAPHTSMVIRVLQEGGQKALLRTVSPRCEQPCSISALAGQERCLAARANPGSARKSGEVERRSVCTMRSATVASRSRLDRYWVSTHQLYPLDQGNSPLGQPRFRGRA